MLAVLAHQFKRAMCKNMPDAGTGAALTVKCLHLLHVQSVIDCVSGDALDRKVPAIPNNGDATCELQASGAVVMQARWTDTF